MLEGSAGDNLVGSEKYGHPGLRGLDSRKNGFGLSEKVALGGFGPG